ncbi:extracellular catalytic domain type 1 short-chain-length polyhydroxyalkanoate depolymerase [Janthinobacterium agaricidamnosum]|uniref:Esterase, PHB depolymerase family protein n=1 Tax=Janthinobacterium agaricidamnosum NBRC 102515 = DSM 9628 TaxID=1349767 RepID=W0V3X9_9BURK|nr:PHB depolymerase family esterase [Janthinobacterium agaricidamnosum]CDG81957.1 esterase, PHB depolymerase family protein [Janthinobacterium agaricidamnosum NBRC 102515 = DSM 9628]
MVSSSTKWIRTLVRAGKMQQRSAKKLVKSLLAPLVVKPVAKPRGKPERRSKPAAPPSPFKTRVTLNKRPRSKAASSDVLPGKWLASYHAAAPELGGLAARRISYWLYLPHRPPSAAVQQRGLPLIVMLHGCEQSATQFAQGTRMNRLAEQKGYAVLYPQQSLRSHARRCWKWYEKMTQEGGGDARLIVGLIEQVAARYAIDPTRIYLAGISAGAGMANIIALRHPELIAALGLHSGPMFGGGHNMIGALGVMQHGASSRVDRAIDEVLAARPGFPGMPTILIQGDSDKVVRPINQTQLMRQSILLNRMPKETEVSVEIMPPGAPGSRNPARGCQLRDFHVDGKLMLRVAKIEHLEHAWSGGDASLAFHAKAGPDASKMMLEFFARHQRRRA